jgi:hypothetical protein
LDHVVAATEHLASQEYVDDLHNEQLRRQRRNARITIIAAIVISLGLTGIGYTVLKLYGLASDVTVIAQASANDAKVNRQLNFQTSQAVDILLECTTATPKNDSDIHECYEQAQSNSSEVIGTLVTTIMATNVCTDAEGTQTFAEIRNCVEDLLPSIRDEDR